MPIGRGTHFKGPILGSNDAWGGAFRNAPIDFVSKMGSHFKGWYEDFRFDVADSTALATHGWTATNVGVPAANTLSVSSYDLFLKIDPGTTADTGWSLQRLADQTAGTIIPSQQLYGGTTGVPAATTLDNREFVWATRIGYAQTGSVWTSGGTAGGKVLAGIAVSDATATAPTTGEPTLANGGGFGFYINESGQLWAFTQSTTVAADGAVFLVKAQVDNATSASVVGNWLELACRMSYNDASAADATQGIGYWYLNGRLVCKSGDSGWVKTQAKTTAVTTPNLCRFAATGIFSPTFEVTQANPNTAAFLVGVDYIYTAISRPGVTRTSNP